jgi:hypothetical protein
MLSATALADEEEAVEELPKLPMDSGLYLELNVGSDVQFAAVKPDALGFSYGATLLPGLDFGFCGQTVCGVVGMQLGPLWIRGRDEAQNQDLDRTKFLFSPHLGFFHYVGEHWTMNYMASMPLTDGGPGAQLRIGWTALPDDWGGQYFAIEFGVQATYLQTGIEAAGTDDVHWFAVGPYLGFGWEFWGKFKFIGGGETTEENVGSS